VVIATAGAATGAAGAGSAPIIRAEPRIRMEAFTQIDLHER
jgi:hypothetical protein